MVNQRKGTMSFAWEAVDDRFCLWASGHTKICTKQSACVSNLKVIFLKLCISVVLLAFTTKSSTHMHNIEKPILSLVANLRCLVLWMDALVCNRFDPGHTRSGKTRNTRAASHCLWRWSESETTEFQNMCNFHRILPNYTELLPCITDWFVPHYIHIMCHCCSSIDSFLDCIAAVASDSSLLLHFE